MDKKTLQSILSKPFELSDWRNLLTAVFGVKNFLTKPSEIPLPSNNKANSAFELGSFNTADDRIIGLYLVKVKPEVWLERNKVGLRELLRSVYKYDVDGALIVFEQADKWRLSFVSEIRTFDDEGNITQKITEPKRYTYLLGKGEKTKTPVDRLFSIAGKKLYLEEIRNAFSVEALNEEFYKIVARHFYQLVGATEGKGAKAITYDRILNLPIGKPADNASKKIYQEFAVRLIGRTVFCWFLKVKKSDEGISLLPEHLLSSEAVKENSNYYHSILEKLFFQTLNTPMSERWKELPEGCEQIPFLNGGLFEPQTEDYYKPNKTTGFSDHINTLQIPDEWFKSFFEYLEQYNFTIDENSVVDIEVSVDPEMLGRIFENLLAEIDPDSGETARKATGSFYTPREIVDYMATESLVLYLHNQTQIDKELLKPIFKIDSEVSFSKSDAEKILEALDRLKIFDPACGSGAFPMGVLQKIVMALQKLDPHAKWWKARQISRIENALLRKQVKEKLESTTVEYARKIGVIQNTLYGVDIQPIAAEISKLRCFLTLVVDENIDETKPNRGVEPLPNLEFKFVTADALLQLPPEKDFGGLFNSNDDLEKLKEIRLDYLQSFGEHKNQLKAEFKRIQDKIVKQQMKHGVADVNSRAFLISTWKPFSNEKVDWFDPLWMYGVKDFDIVIGNPPYVSAPSMVANNPEVRQAIINSKNYTTLYQKWDLYIPFMEKGLQLLCNSGIFSMIVPYPVTNQTYGKKLRELIVSEYNLLEIVDLNGTKVFANATVSNCIPFVSKQAPKVKCVISQINESKVIKNVFEQNITDLVQDANTAVWNLTQENRASSQHSEFNTLGDFCYISKGMVLNADEKIAKGKFTKDDLITDAYDKIHCREYIEAKDIERYKVKNVRYLEYNTDRVPSKLSRPTFKELYEQPKLMFNRLGNLQVYLDDKTKFLHSDSMFSAVLWKDLFGLENKSIAASVKRYSRLKRDEMERLSQQIDLKYLLGLLNSKYASVLLSNLRGGDYHIYPEHIRNIPIKLIPKNQQKAIINLVDYIINLHKVNSQANDFVSNLHLIQMFEGVIDAMVYELYFEEDFKKAGIEFMKYAQRDFKSIEGKSEKEAIAIIEKAYQTLREKDNEIRNNLKLMDIKLADLIMPIKTAR